MLVVLLVAAVAIVVGIIVVAQGGGGELARFPADVPPFDAQVETATDVALLRPPPALWGYNMQYTNDALSRVAQAMTERDVEIADLRRQLEELRPGGQQPGAPGQPAAWQPRPAEESQPWSAWQRPDPAQLRDPSTPEDGG